MTFELEKHSTAPMEIIATVLNEEDVSTDDMTRYEVSLSLAQRKIFLECRDELQLPIIQISRLNHSDRSRLIEYIRNEFSGQPPNFRGIPGHLQVREALEIWVRMQDDMLRQEDFVEAA